MAPSRRFESSSRLPERLIDQWSADAGWVRARNTAEAVGRLSSARFPIEDAVGPAAFEHDTLPLPPALGAGTEALWPHADSLYDCLPLPEWPDRPALSARQVAQLTQLLLQGGFLREERVRYES